MFRFGSGPKVENSVAYHVKVAESLEFLKQLESLRMERPAVAMFAQFILLKDLIHRMINLVYVVDVNNI